ncbi:MAG: nicotinate phosphoribosyltransferase [bacterium]|nr:nicotinate phosphoribosyltransferase [bacterium]
MKPANNFVSPMLTDFYQLTMAYAYWKDGKHEEPAVFDVFFRQNPFGKSFTIFAGLEEVLRFVSAYRFADEDIEYIKSLMPGCDAEFFDWLKRADCSKIKIYAVREGSVVFPRIPLIRVEGPLAIAQLLETTILNLVNYAGLVATNAACFRLAVGDESKVLLEFGARRAQGPDGAVSASRYSVIGGFNGTSNVLAGKLFGLTVKGTHAHSYVSSFSGLDDLKTNSIIDPDGKKHDFVSLALKFRKQLGFNHTNEGELAAFIAYAQAFPEGFLALVDTYDTLNSGVPNFLSVVMALHAIGYKPIGIRLDSGDLAYLSKKAKKMFQQVRERFPVDGFPNLLIVASNDINEATLISLKQQGHEIDVFGIGTHLVTCQTQPALGCVYKLVEVNGKQRIKLSQDVDKVTLPGRKEAYRLIGSEGTALLDLMIPVGEAPPRPGERILCRHPFEETKRVYVIPTEVISLHQCVWDGRINVPLPSVKELRRYTLDQLGLMRNDHLRTLNPTPYKVSVSNRLYDFIHELWMQEAPITEIQ